MIFIVIVTVVFGGMSLYNAILEGKVYPVCNAIINKGIYLKLFKKSRNVELECFENSEFYDKYTLAMEKADERLKATVEVVFGVIFGVIGMFLSSYTMTLVRMTGLVGKIKLTLMIIEAIGLATAAIGFIYGLVNLF